MSSRTGRVAIVALVAQGAVAWPRVDRILNARAPQATNQVVCSYSCPAANGSYIQDKNEWFELLCNQNVPSGPQLAVQQVSNMGDCITQCENASGCLAVASANSSCTQLAQPTTYLTVSNARGAIRNSPTNSATYYDLQCKSSIYTISSTSATASSTSTPTPTAAATMLPYSTTTGFIVDSELEYTSTNIANHVVYVGQHIAANTTSASASPISVTLTMTTNGPDTTYTLTASSSDSVITSSQVISATTSNTANPALPSYSPSDGGKLSCPANDRTAFTDVTGKSYTVSCYTDYFNYVENLTYAVSLDACAADCSNMAGCIAAVWRPGSGNGPCYLKDGVGYASNDLGLMALLPNDETLSTLLTTSAATSFTNNHGTSNAVTSTSTSAPVPTTSTSSEELTVVTVHSTTTVMSTSTIAPAPTTSTFSDEITVITLNSTTTVSGTASITSSHTTTVETSHVVLSSTITIGSSTAVVAVTSTMIIGPASGSSFSSIANLTSIPSTSPTLTTTVISPTSSVSTTTALSTATVKTPYAPCGVLNHKGNTFYLRTHVMYGNNEFENLYVQYIIYGAPPHNPSLSTNRNTAAQVFYDLSTSSVAIYHGECTFSGLKLNRDRDMNTWSPVLIGDEVGTSKMSIANGELWWDNDRFGSWLICKDPDNGVYELMWWDTITDRGIDGQRCAKVQLLTENL